MSENGRIRFGVFDFDPASGELRSEGTPVRLQAQPAQVLGLLLQNAGEVVSRETLRTAVWGTETFVDFDRGLNFCVAQIRSALGDSAESPRFIRTIPKKGYQFVAPVARRPEPVVTAKRRFVWTASVAAGIVMGALALWGWSSLAAKPSVRVAVTRFDNETGDPQYDRLADALTDSVVVELAVAAADRYDVIGNASILRLPRAKRDLIAIGTSLHAGYVVLGQVQNSADGVRVLVHLIAVPEQTHIQVVRNELSSSEVFQSQAVIARQVAEQFAVPLAAGRRQRIASPTPVSH